MVEISEAPGEVLLAIDVGGTKLAAGVVGLDGMLLTRCQVPTPRDADGEGLLAALLDVAEQVSADAPAPAPAPVRFVAVGVGCGGPMTAGGGEVSPLHLPAWRAFPLRRRIGEWAGVPVFVDNDAKALARGEGWRGAAVGETSFLGMVVSTGVGGGLVSDGRLLDGATGNAGHIGHVVVEPGGLRCPCGARGCLEAYACGPAILRWSGAPPEAATPDVVARVGLLVGRAVASVANLMDLRLAVVAGSVALGFGAPFFAAAQAELDRSCRLDFSRGVRIVPAALAADGPLIGAAAVALAGLHPGA